MYKDIIFSLFGRFEKQIDKNKDENGKGTHERYNEALGNDIDTWVQPFIYNYAKNHYGNEMLAAYQDLRALDLGVLQFSFSDIETDEYGIGEYNFGQYGGVSGVSRFEASVNKIILAQWHKINTWRGTARFIELIARIIDTKIIKIEIENLYNSSEYGTAEYGINEYGMSACRNCAKYNIKITAQDVKINPYLKSAIKKIIEYNNPIDAIFEKIYYNGTIIEI